jgi:hypothetical protein
MTRARTPCVPRRMRALTIRQRWPLLLTCAIRSRPRVARLMRRWLFHCQRLTTACLAGHADGDLWEGKRQAAQLLPEPAPRGPGIGRRGGTPRIVDAAAVGVTEPEAREERMHAQDIVDGVLLFLAALTARLGSRGLGADEAPLGAVMGKRGDAGAAAGTAPTGAGASARGATTAARAASETPSRGARAANERGGAAPRVRRAARRTGRRT